MYFFQYLENGLYFFGHFWEEQKTSKFFDFGEVKFCYFSEEKCAAGAENFFQLKFPSEDFSGVMLGRGMLESGRRSLQKCSF